MSDRYARLFERLAGRREGAFVPFTVLGDPDPSTSLDILRAFVAGGADALELGIPFSDPVADGPVIQRADDRALAAGITPAAAFGLIASIRAEAPELPIGLLMYANLVEAPGLDGFYAQAAAAGVDSVLVADVPTVEVSPYAAAARRHGVAPVLIAAPTSTDAHLREVARSCEGYTYVVTRAGVTGADEDAFTAHDRVLGRLREFGAPPPVLGFGISKPEHVRAALAGGAAGAISGSAVVRRIEAGLDTREDLLASVRSFVAEMKAATRPE